MYYLHPCKQNVVELPVEIQLGEDNQFIELVLNQNCDEVDCKSKSRQTSRKD